MLSDRYLVDTNCLLRLIVIKDADSASCQQAVAALRRNNIPLHFTLQNASEFWNTCTRPIEANGLAMEPAAVAYTLRVLLSQFSMMTDTDAIFSTWLTLATRYAVRGVQAHDTKLVAAMQVHRIPAILTLNDRHFRRFEDLIQVVRPEDVLRG